jgi:5S rRNA maturation endonuclease (ribonuclease M5)
VKLNRLYEEVIEEIERLKELSIDFPIIVEGKKDERALRMLGVNGKFFFANAMPVYELCEIISDKFPEVILLTDLDEAGKKITKKIKALLSQKGVRINEKFRFSLLRKLNTCQVESIYSRVKKIEGQL